MSDRTTCARENGVVFVEAAIVMPLLLTISFASIYFFLIAAQNFGVQMVANDIARVAALSLSAQAPTEGGCTLMCRQPNRSASEVFDLDQIQATYTNCFKGCAASQYLLKSDQLQIFVDAMPVGVPENSTIKSEVAAGDMVRVSILYPASAVLGAKIPFLGNLDTNIEGSSVAVIEKR